MTKTTKGSDTATSAGQRDTWFCHLWLGRGNPATRWHLLLAGIFALFFSSISYALAISVLHWSMPLKLVGWLLLVITVGLIVWGIRALAIVVLHMGLRRLLVRLGILYIVAVILVGLLANADETGANNWLGSASYVARWPINRSKALYYQAQALPDALRFAATGRREPMRMADTEWVDGVAPTPVVANAVSLPQTIDSTATSTHPSAQGDQISIGTVVVITDTGNANLRGRALPSLEGSVVVRFAPGSRLTVIDGPREADGLRWWRVLGDAGEGWCVADFLVVAL
jgi:hypothetical protein